MNCREFRRIHLDFTDKTLGAPQFAEALEHVEVCADCARFDALVRRSLMLVHSLPPVAPDPRSHPRIMARVARQGGAPGRSIIPVSGMLAAASLAFAIGLLSSAFLLRRPASIASSLPPVVATAALPAPAPFNVRVPERAPRPRVDILAAPAGGIPLWPAAMLLDESSVRFVSVQSTAAVPAR